ncbi:MAG: hypothetical protein GY811_06455 [Myxococcales bacterium]|nr:hypothetical protein [Myxococcales bacterium]
MKVALWRAMMSASTSAPLRILLLAAATALSACATDTAQPFDSDKADQGDPLLGSDGYNNNPMLVPFDGNFDMCMNGPAGG